MKYLIFTLLYFALCLTPQYGLASNLTNKSLYVGTLKDIGTFSYCVANEAVSQVLIGDYKFTRLLHSSAENLDQPQPWITATLSFLVEKLNDSKKAIFRVVLTSTDTKLGWQLVQSASGEIAPYSTKISSEAFLVGADKTVIGKVDLSACSDQ